MGFTDAFVVVAVNAAAATAATTAAALVDSSCFCFLIVRKCCLLSFVFEEAPREMLSSSSSSSSAEAAAAAAATTAAVATTVTTASSSSLSLSNNNPTSTLFSSENSNVQLWSQFPQKLTLDQVCSKFGIDIINNRYNAVFWQIITSSSEKVVITDDILQCINYSGSTYAKRKKNFTQYLRNNPNIRYEEISNCSSKCSGDSNEQQQQDHRHKSLVLSKLDFENIIMQINTRHQQQQQPLQLYLHQRSQQQQHQQQQSSQGQQNCHWKHLYIILKYIHSKYTEYEICYEQNITKLYQQHNNLLMKSIEKLTEMIYNNRCAMITNSNNNCITTTATNTLTTCNSCITASTTTTTTTATPAAAIQTLLPSAAIASSYHNPPPPTQQNPQPQPQLQQRLNYRKQRHLGRLNISYFHIIC